MRIIVGLGNPGPQYARTRHNVGWRCLDAAAARWGVPVKERRPLALLGQGTVREVPVVLAKPRTFVNLSGQGVRYLRARFGATPADLVVIYDDMDLPLGRLRLRPRGSAGGHRGMASVIEALETEEFPRLRVGIGRPPPGVDPVQYVLEPFTPEEEQAVAEVAARAAEALEVLLVRGLEAAMNEFNR